jgi:hypothetical protein
MRGAVAVAVNKGLELVVRKRSAICLLFATYWLTVKIINLIRLLYMLQLHIRRVPPSVGSARTSRLWENHTDSQSSTVLSHMAA